MFRAFSILGLVGVAALTGVSAHAACGGGGYKAAPARAHQVSVTETVVVDEKASKLQGLQRDIDKAQAKLDHCDGDCEKERRKLQEARAKYARKAGEA
jgi:hypothetical protein